MAIRISKTSKNSGVTFNQKEVMDYLTEKFGRRKMLKIYDEALTKAAEVVYKAVKANIRYFRDTGAEYAEVKLTDPFWESGLRTVRIYWEGEKHRYSIVHLNEKGFHARNGKFIRPKGMGAIDKALRSARKTFYDTYTKEVEKLLL